jgi:hypothetical protein
LYQFLAILYQLLAEALQHTAYDAYDSELELEEEMQVTTTGIDLTSFAAVVVVAAVVAAVRENAAELGFAKFAVVPSDDDAYSKSGAMQIVVDVVVLADDDDAVVVAGGGGVVAAAAVAVDVDAVVEAVAPTAGYDSVVVLAASGTAESCRYCSNFQKTLAKITIFLRGHS